MNKKVIFSLGSAILLASSLLAADANPSNSGMQGIPKKNMPAKHQMHHHKDPFISVVMGLKLSDDQRTKIRNIFRESMKNAPKPYEAFSETGFDKALFIKLSKEKRDTMIEKRAETIEKIYNVLNASQKKMLKEELSKKRDFAMMGAYKD